MRVSFAIDGQTNRKHENGSDFRLAPDEYGSREEMIQTGNVAVNWYMTGHNICQWYMDNDDGDDDADDDDTDGNDDDDSWWLWWW